MSALPRDAMLLRIHVGEQEKAGHEPLYEAVVMKAREMHLAGASVLRGVMGFGHSGQIHSAKILRLSEDLPLVIELIDTEDKLMGLLDAVGDMLGSTLITLEKVQVLQYGPHKNGKSA